MSPGSSEVSTCVRSRAAQPSTERVAGPGPCGRSSRDGSIHDMSDRYTSDNAFAVHLAMLNSMSFAGTRTCACAAFGGYSQLLAG